MDLSGKFADEALKQEEKQTTTGGGSGGSDFFETKLPDPTKTSATSFFEASYQEDRSLEDELTRELDFKSSGLSEFNPTHFSSQITQPSDSSTSSSQHLHDFDLIGGGESSLGGFGDIMESSTGSNKDLLSESSQDMSIGEAYDRASPNMMDFSFSPKKSLGKEVEKEEGKLKQGDQTFIVGGGGFSQDSLQNIGRDEEIFKSTAAGGMQKNFYEDEGYGFETSQSQATTNVTKDFKEDFSFGSGGGTTTFNRPDIAGESFMENIVAGERHSDFSSSLSNPVSSSYENYDFGEKKDDFFAHPPPSSKTIDDTIAASAASSDLTSKMEFDLLAKTSSIKNPLVVDDDIPPPIPKHAYELEQTIQNPFNKNSDYEEDELNVLSSKLSDSLEVLKESPQKDLTMMDLEDFPSSKGSTKSISPNGNSSNNNKNISGESGINEVIAPEMIESGLFSQISSSSSRGGRGDGNSSSYDFMEDRMATNKQDNNKYLDQEPDIMTSSLLTGINSTLDDVLPPKQYYESEESSLKTDSVYDDSSTSKKIPEFDTDIDNTLNSSGKSTVSSNIDNVNPPAKYYESEESPFKTSTQFEHYSAPLSATKKTKEYDSSDIMTSSLRSSNNTTLGDDPPPKYYESEESSIKTDVTFEDYGMPKKMDLGKLDEYLQKESSSFKEMNVEPIKTTKPKTPPKIVEDFDTFIYEEKKEEAITTKKEAEPTIIKSPPEPVSIKELPKEPKEEKKKEVIIPEPIRPKIIEEPPKPVTKPSTTIKKSAPIFNPNDEISEDVEKILNILNPKAWFNPEKLHPKVSELVYWRDPKKSGAVFGTIFAILIALTFLSFISVVAYTSLAILAGTFSFRIYKNVLQAIQKTQDGHPFKEYLEYDLNLPSDKAQEVSNAIISYVNNYVSQIRRLFLVEDLVDSAKFGALLYFFTYLGSWFNGLTLLIIAFVALFALPKVYETNKTVIDQYIELASGKFSEINEKITTALPFLAKKEKAQ